MIGPAALLGSILLQSGNSVNNLCTVHPLLPQPSAIQDLGRDRIVGMNQEGINHLALDRAPRRLERINSLKFSLSIKMSDLRPSAKEFVPSGDYIAADVATQYLRNQLENERAKNRRLEEALREEEAANDDLANKLTEARRQLANEQAKNQRLVEDLQEEAEVSDKLLAKLNKARTALRQIESSLMPGAR